MPELSDLNSKIAELKKLKFEVAHDKSILEVKEHALQDLKDDIMEIMHQAGAMSYKSNLGTLSLNRKQTVKILDPVKVEFWLRNSSGLDYRQYSRLDTMKLKPILEEAVLVDGIIVEGAEMQINEYISLREPTAKK